MDCSVQKSVFRFKNIACLSFRNQGKMQKVTKKEAPVKIGKVNIEKQKSQL